MGAAISMAANGLGAILGNALVAPAKAVLGRTCEDICTGAWDVVCFIENICIASLVKLAMVVGLSLVTFFFIYLLFKVGIFQCIIGGSCQMMCAACEAYCTALQDICCFLWHKIKNTERVYRGRRFYDMEEGYTSSDTTGSSYGRYESRIWKKKRSIRERRKDEIRRSLYPVRRRTKGRSVYNSGGSRHHVRLKTNEVSVHLKGAGRHQSLKRIQVRSRSRNALILRRHRSHDWH